MKNGTFNLLGDFKDGVAQLKPNKYLLKVTSPVEEEETDPKGGKKDAKKAPPPEETDTTGNEIKIVIDIANPEEAQRVLGLSLTVVFQGPEYEDPNPPEEDEASKNKKKGAPTEPEIRMITPDPTIMEHEHGR